MDSSTLSHAIIPAADKLKLWNVFRNVGAEGEEILKTAKLVHVHDKEGFVVTNTDETYHLTPETTLIPELCGVRVKGTHFGKDTWCSKFRSAKTSIKKQMEQLGRFSYFVEDGCTPKQVNLMKMKVRQVALQGVRKGRVVALTVRGDVYHWGTIGGIIIRAPRLMDKKEWNFVMGKDFWNAISVGRSFGANFVLTDRGKECMNIDSYV
ncbi:hypothetical protein Fcan01_19448 [Folsomia candida]|uniref:Uncharacterized protein n=1 Tax=Folsomia candida TaxID=158441 RepID=A0A226DJZ9_FOLCA|nr:hypothetical protein Fcan01_19448 [Folsomia candida]